MYVSGKRSIPKIRARDVFGIPYEQIDACEKKLVWHALIMTLILDYHETGIFFTL